jgi:hypothetical protein
MAFVSFALNHAMRYLCIWVIPFQYGFVDEKWSPLNRIWLLQYKMRVFKNVGPND